MAVNDKSQWEIWADMTSYAHAKQTYEDALQIAKESKLDTALMALGAAYKELVICYVTPHEMVPITEVMELKNSLEEKIRQLRKHVSPQQLRLSPGLKMVLGTGAYDLAELATAAVQKQESAGQAPPQP
ncbi:hypothetical protein HYX10_01385 [Candidatus Woesearchaeota archaeon]|nr:hypothetical protein [Candidatus Woesearchaeota archaeon]